MKHYYLINGTVYECDFKIPDSADFTYYKDDLKSSIVTNYELNKIIGYQRQLSKQFHISPIIDITESVQLKSEQSCPYQFTSRCTQGRCDCETFNMIVFKEPSLKEIESQEEILRSLISKLNFEYTIDDLLKQFEIIRK